jgi:hypothetical protein
MHSNYFLNKMDPDAKKKLKAKLREKKESRKNGTPVVPPDLFSGETDILKIMEQVNKVLHELGFRRTHSDPTVWVLPNPAKENDIVGIIGAHVDDFLMSGRGPYWEKCLSTLMTAFRWTPLEEHTFKQCGVLVEQQGDMIVQHQDEYIASLGEIDLKPERSKELNSPVTEQERTELRALLGGMQWLVGQSMVYGNVDVNLLQSDVATATVETLLTANKVLRKLRTSPNRLYTKKIV